MITLSINDSLCTEHMDQAVEEVFHAMLDRDCAPLHPIEFGPCDFTATISISGALEASCVLDFPAPSAGKLTSALLGEGTYDHAMITDAIGELCNMIAGGWKRRLASDCEDLKLSLPIFSKEPDRLPAAGELRRTYGFDDATFLITLRQF